MEKYKYLIIGLSTVFTITIAALYCYRVLFKPVELVFGDFAGSNWEIPNWQSSKFTDEAIAKFEALHPRIKIKYLTGTPKSYYSEWLAQKIVKGQEPDVFCVLEGDFNTFASIGILKKLDKLIAGDPGFDPDQFYEKAIKSGQFDGWQYALAREVVPVLMFANKTILAKERIPVPKGDWTWNDYYNICRKVTRDLDGDGRTDQFGTVGFDWQHAVYTNGQQLFNLNGNQTMFTEPGVIEAIEFVRKLNKLNSNTRPTPGDFDDGKVVFRPFPFSAYRAYKAYPYRLIRYAQFDWECIKLPRGPRGKNASELYSFLIGISSRTKHSREAWEFLKFLVYDRNSQMNVFKYSYGVPVLRKVTESKEADLELSKYTPDKEISVDKMVLSQVIEESTVTPRFHKYEEAMEMADKEIYRLTNDDIPIESSLQKFN
ncbi:MAG: ABC transporter substrate-binding protein, partial [Bacillota bacterium]